MIQIIYDRVGKIVSFRLKRVAFNRARSSALSLCLHVSFIAKPLHTFARHAVASPARSSMLVVLLTIIMVGFAAPLKAGENANPSGYPLPRFASLRSEPINVRKGPGIRYEVAWVYVRARLPVEIIQEFDIWRKIRDSDGQEGWIQQNLLSGNRTGYIAPWSPDARVPIRAGNNKTAPVRAWLTSKYLIKIRRCDGSFCEVSASNTSGAGRRNYSGFVEQSQIWGVYPNEIVK